MSERDVVERTQVPGTVVALRAELEALGVEPGMVLLVHASLSALGWICGGDVAVIQALLQVLGESGALVMPSFTGGLTDPKNWQHPPVPEEWKDTIRAETPAFDLLRTPTRMMGQIAETFRTWPGVERSNHPHCSFAAWGSQASKIVADHQLDNGLGEGSPLARIYELSGWILLLGVGFGNNSSMHLSEYRASFPGKIYEPNGAPMLVNGYREWVTVNDLSVDSDDFPAIGESFMAETQVVQEGRLGEAQALLMPQRQIVDYAVEWMETNRRED